MKEKKKIIFLLSIIFLLVLLVIITSYKHNKKLVEIEKECKEENIEEPTYKEEQTYYKKINYNTLKKLMSKEELSYIAITDNLEYSYEEFKNFINYIAFKKEIELSYLELNTLDKEELITFYEQDDFLKNYNNYIIGVKDNTIYSFISFNPSKIEEYYKIIRGDD